MSERQRHENSGHGQTAVPLDLLREQFEAAWQDALNGAPWPDLDQYLATAAATERPRLQRELETIDRDYRQRLAAINPAYASTLDFKGYYQAGEVPAAGCSSEGAAQTSNEVTAPIGGCARTETLSGAPLGGTPVEAATLPPRLPDFTAAPDQSMNIPGYEIQARAVTAPERLWRWCRRNPGVALLSAAVLVLLVAVAITSTVFAVLIAQERDEKEREKRAAVEARDLADRQARAAERARMEADENAKLANEQSNLALTTLYAVVRKVQSRLRGQRSMQKLNQEVLQEALAGLERVVRTAGSSALISRTKAAAYQRMGDISLELGRTETALQQYKEAQQLLEDLAANDPASEVHRWNLSVIYDKLGEANHQLLGEATLAREYYQKCLDLRVGLSQTTLQTPELKNRVPLQLALTYAKFGNLTLTLGDPATAWTYYQKYLQLQQGRSYATLRDVLSAANAPSAKGVQYATSVWIKLGDLSFHLQDVDTCRSCYEKALKGSQTLVNRDSNNLMSKRDLAAALSALGDLELQLGHASPARAFYLRAHELYAAVVVGNPESADAQRDLTLADYRLGTVSLRLQDMSAADKYYQECLKRRQTLAANDPRNASKQIDLMLVRGRCGRHVEAAKQAGAWHTQAPADPSILFCVACGYALCVPAVEHGKTKEQLTAEDRALQQRYADAALEALAQAVERGYRDLVAVQVDPDLDALRNQARYPAVLEKFKQQPGRRAQVTTEQVN